MKLQHYAILLETHSTLRRLMDPHFDSIRRKMMAVYPHVSLKRPRPRVSNSTELSIIFPFPSDLLMAPFGTPAILN